jgi:citrate synthase
MQKAGLEDVVAATSSICDVNGKEARLIYSGYDIHDLAEHSTFEEVVYLLWHGRLPAKQELETLTKALRTNRQLPGEVIKLMQQLPKNSNPMGVLRTVVSSLSLWDSEISTSDRQANTARATRLMALLPTIIAYWDNIRNNRKLLEPKPDNSLAANFLYLLNQKEPDEVSVKSLDIALILHADHELNASTFAARVAAATLADMYSAVVAAIGTLSGPLHGGANQEVIKMLLKIKDPNNVDPFVHHMMEEHQKIMGFGHRVYKTGDPRVPHLREMSKQLGERLGQPKWYQMSTEIEKLVMADKGLHSNVDFYSASVYYMLGIPTDLFTPIFAMSRISGWTAHILEQYSNNRLIRPRAEYTGERDLKYVPVSLR